MPLVALKHTISYILVLALVGCIEHAEAESFMDLWLSRQQSRTQDDWLSQQVASQMQAQIPSSSSFVQDEWLARQHAKSEEDWLARQAASEADSSKSFSQDSWLSRQADSSDSSPEEVMLSQEAWTPAASWEADEDLEQSLLSDIEVALGKEHRNLIEGRIVTIEERMRPMFQALPKNEYGKLGHSSVRYMLHRFFVEQHGWSIDGLFTEGAALNTSSPSHTLKDRVPMFVEGLFEKRLGGRGFAVREMAVLVAVIEDSVHQEAQQELKNTYKALSIPVDAKLDKEQVEVFIEVYMSGFVMNTNMSNVSADFLYDQIANMPVFYPTWLRAQDFFRQVRHTHVGGKEVVSFPEVSAIVKELVDTFGTFHGKQCQGLKSSLKSLEKGGSSGCVALPDFYKKGLKADSNWLFIESPEYLRQLGVLDETDAKNPRLLSANYINGPSNCLQPTGYYMVCCHNECDGVLGNLEMQLGKPSATPSEITEALRATSSLKATSLRAGLLAPTLRRRLQEVAEYHGGRVPIHGRLFAQWLHHVYPQECPYPHVSGTKHPQWVEDFEEETGKMSQLTDAEMESFVLNASKVSTVKANKSIADAGSCAPWQNEEELFAPIPSMMPLHELENDPHVWNFAGAVACLAALATFAISLSRTCKSVMKIKYQSKMLQI
jgi:hypothetical protein